MYKLQLVQLVRKESEMEKLYKRLKLLQLLAIPLGILMYGCTYKSFGLVISLALGFAAGAAFYFLVKKEISRIAGEAIVSNIKKAISENGNVENYVEIRRIKSGIIARVYLVNAKVNVGKVYSAIMESIESSGFKKFVWAMQLTEIPGANALGAARDKLNQQLIQELMKRKNKEDDR